MKAENNLKHYLIFTYLLFWTLLGATGLFISLGVPEPIQNIMKNISAWTPTFVILLMFKRLYPGTSFKDYLVSNFLIKVKPGYFVLALLLQSAVFIGAILAYSAFNNLTPGSLPLIGISGLISALLMSATSGAVGEELGWRGYALNTWQKKYSPLKSSLFVGLVWGFWHLPLWIISGYSGLDLIIYCGAFLVAIVSLSVVITYFYNKSGNILIAMWMHFLFNILLQLVLIELLQLLFYVSVGYLLLAIILILTKKQELNILPGIKT